MAKPKKLKPTVSHVEANCPDCLEPLFDPITGSVSIYILDYTKNIVLKCHVCGVEYEVNIKPYL